MASAYFINAGPTNLQVGLNAGPPNSLLPIVVGTDVVSAPAWPASIESFAEPNVFSGKGNANEVLFITEQSPNTLRFIITSTVSTILDLYFFMSADSIVGWDQTGSTYGIVINNMSAEAAEDSKSSYSDGRTSA
jgi:hypothetical protein